MKYLTLILVLTFSLSAFAQKKPFDVSIEKLPPKFKGDRFQTLLDEVIQRYLTDPEPIKGEYEKNEDFKKRKAEFFEKPFPSGTNKDSLLAFVVPSSQLSIEYDADREIFNVKSKLYYPCETSTEYWWICKALVMNYKFDDRGDYYGSNLFGAAKLVDKRTEYLDVIELADWSSVKPNEYNSYSFELPIEINQAKKVKPQLSVLVIGYLAQKPYDIYNIITEPTLGDPVDKRTFIKSLVIDIRSVWFFNNLTGEIYKKMDSTEERIKDN